MKSYSKVPFRLVSSLSSRLKDSNIRSPDIYDGCIILGMIIYAAIFSYISVFKYNIFHLERDLAILNQAFWTTVKYGDFFYNSLEGCSHFFVHFSPIFFSLIPIYSLFPVPQTLLIAQSILLSLGAVPIYLCGREILGRRVGCLIGTLYLLYPSLHGVNLYDFHEVAFIPFLLGMAVFGLTTEKKSLMLFFAFLSLLVKEDISLIIMMMGIIGLYKTRSKPFNERWQYIALIIMGLSTLLFFYAVIRPLFSSAGIATQYNFLAQYADPIGNFSSNNEYRVAYLLQTFSPLIFLPLFSPLNFAISIPALCELLLPYPRFYFNIHSHYSASLIPILFISMIYGLYALKSTRFIRRHNLYVAILFFMTISSIFCSIWYSPAGYQIKIIQNMDSFPLDEHREYLNQVLSVIPENASVSTQWNLLPLLSNRRELQLDDIEKSDVIVIDDELPWRMGLFLSNIQNIEKKYDLLFYKKNIYLYGKKTNEGIRSEINQSLYRLGM